jgi:putative transcriptional regulator
MISFVETKLFTRLIGDLLGDDEYALLQQALIANPELGDVIPGSGGVRKMRWGATGRGKRGGLRVIYFLRTRQGQIWMLTIYPKNVADKAVARRNVGREILEGLRELKRGDVGRVVNVPSVSAVRERTGLSQVKFASLLGVSVRTLQEWEQGRRAPSGAARTLLMVAARNPKALLDVA